MKTALLLALLVGCAAASAAPPAPMSSPAEYDERPISAAAGEDYFLHTGGGDPYATGISYPVFLALMDAFPDELGANWHEFAAKFGLNPDADPGKPPVGLHLTTDPLTGTPWLVGNCQFCHSSRIRLASGDVVVSGLGSRRVRPHAYANAILRIGGDPRLTAAMIDPLAARHAATLGVRWTPLITDATVDGMRALSRRRKAFADALPGRVATIESFAVVLGEARGKAIALAKDIGWAKIPDVRGFPYRDTFSYDASGYGSPQALVLDADFVAGTRPEWYVTHPYIATSMYLYLRQFRRKLPFPAPIDAGLAARGKARFEQTCAPCHGHYADNGDVAYHERVISIDEVGTDPARAEAVTADYVDAANAYPLTRGLARVRHTGGYVPPILRDVWARGCYGHAGQWPSLAALATPPAERPRRFIVEPDALYDLVRVGEAYDVSDRALKAGEYRVEGQGFGVEGHPFLSDLPGEERRAVIEYLKTL